MVEVLAALLFLAIVIPVSLQALHVASQFGEIAARKAEAARVADRVLNEAAVTGSSGGQNGTAAENGHPYRWTLRNDVWTVAAMQVLTVEVTYAARGRDYAVRLSTLTAWPAGLQR